MYGPHKESLDTYYFQTGGKLTSALVIASQAMNAALNQNEAVLAVLILAIALQMLAHRDGLLNKAVQVLRDLGSQTYTQTGQL